ncbi:MAG TPA: glycosyltransferase family 2 protein [Caulobacteraceae bacterium]|nr:glycosyltransferase family 2 protein [Caulobacteraceae bacterium]
MDGVAVLIAARDAAGTIARAVRSALAQPEAAEVVVVDDGSTDGTAAVAREADDGSGRLNVVVQENTGPSGARNRAMSSTSAPLLCVLDADDLMTPGRLGRLLETSGEGWDFVADDLLTAREGRESGPYGRLLGVDKAGEVDLASFVRANISDPRRPRGEMGFLKPLVRRSFLERTGLRYDGRMRLGEDYAFYAEALARGARFRLTPACGYVAIARKGSLSEAHGAVDLKALIDADDRLLAQPDLSPEAVAALKAHQRSIRLKWSHRRALDARKAGRLGAAVRVLAESPATAVYILRETARARAVSAARRLVGRRGWAAIEAEPAAAGSEQGRG